ncbi:uncharacterized protein LOC141632419 [Silene latifolia]|uniref:uncharacterized protein LOC141632419 n=1 Tax=Silene latifolia TaxID=37657 RepID=UPI003D773888
MGANPPSHVVGGFVRRMWGKLSIDKVAFKPNGICIVRFKKMEDKEAVLNGLVGKPVCSDNVTKEKEFLDYARFMVEVPYTMSGSPLSALVVMEWDMRLGLARRVGYAPRARHDKEVQVELVQLPQIDPNAVVTPMPMRGNQVLNSMSPARMFNRLSKKNEGFSQGGPSFVEVLSLSLRRNLLSSLGKGRLTHTGDHGDVRRFLHLNNVGFFGLLETRVKTSAINKVQLGLGDHWKFLNNNDVREGGRIWVVWDNSMFDVIVLVKTAQGAALNADRKELWQSLLDFHSSLQGPWMVMGDFNNVLNMDERIGAPVTLAEVKDFQECVDACGLYDLSSTGAYFTWNNKQEGDERVFSRIDRVLANDTWILNGPDGSITFMPKAYMIIVLAL